LSFCDNHSRPSNLDSVQAFKKRMKLGRFADKDPEAEARAAVQEEQERTEAEAIPIGARCEVTLPGTMPKRGTVMFVGMCVQEHVVTGTPHVRTCMHTHAQSV
jgi:hypothetical protein